MVTALILRGCKGFRIIFEKHDFSYMKGNIKIPILIFFYELINLSVQKGGEKMSIKNRCLKMIDELGIVKAKFAANVGIGRSTFFMWLNGEIELSDSKIKAIESYLTKYGF